MEIMLVAIGGFFGAISRYKMSLILNNIAKKYKFPSTIFINIIGTFLLALIVKVENNLSIFLIDGFLGSFTTFSAIMAENLVYFKEGSIKKSFLYLILNFLLAYLVYMLGIYIINL
jgi:CrcB protein